MQFFDLELEEFALVYQGGELAMRFCVQEVKGSAVVLYFEIRLRHPDGSCLFTMKPYVWDAEILTPFEFDVSEDDDAPSLLGITITEVRRGRSSLRVDAPAGYEVIPARQIPEVE